MVDPCKGALDIHAPIPMVYRVEYVKIELESKLNIPYEMGVPDVF
jgi:hypothetical protein